ncbi:hypothetical protein [Paenibacillus piri]|nr:hypothetical protein [Paenibacillus piri]
MSIFFVKMKVGGGGRNRAYPVSLDSALDGAEAVILAAPDTSAG